MTLHKPPLTKKYVIKTAKSNNYIWQYTRQISPPNMIIQQLGFTNIYGNTSHLSPINKLLHNPPRTTLYDITPEKSQHLIRYYTSHLLQIYMISHEPQLTTLYDINPATSQHLILYYTSQISQICMKLHQPHLTT